MKNEIVFCSAAYTSHPNSMREPLIDIEVNCRGTINILEAARRFNPEAKIVHVGTSTQIGKMVYSPVDEKHPEFPMDIYSANKTVSEKYVLIYATAYQMPATVVRFANVFGPRSNIRSPEFGFVNYFIGLGLQGKDIPVFGTGNQLRNLLYVDDCVDALVLAAERDESSGEVFFAVADDQISVGNIAQAISDHIGGSVRSVPWPKDREVIEIGDAIISHDKITSMLGWQPKTDIAAGLAETKEYFGKWLRKYL